MKPEDEWVIHENAHEAIIDKDTFATAKRLRDSRHRPSKTGDLGVLNGLMVCEDCGSKLHLKRQIKKGRDDVRIEYCYYECRNARQFSEFATCDCHAIKREPLEQLVLDEIQQVVAEAKENEVKFIEKMTASEGRERKQMIKKAETELSKAGFRIEELDRIINRIYEDHVAGKLSDERFEKMLTGYETEQADLKKRVSELEKAVGEVNEQTANADKFLRLVKKYTEPAELTGELIRDFVEKIVVGKAEHIGAGHRTKKQKIKISYNYIGEYTDTVMETSRDNKTA